MSNMLDLDILQILFLELLVDLTSIAITLKYGKFKSPYMAFIIPSIRRLKRLNRHKFDYENPTTETTTITLGPAIDASLNVLSSSCYAFFEGRPMPLVTGQLIVALIVHFCPLQQQQLYILLFAHCSFQTIYLRAKCSAKTQKCVCKCTQCIGNATNLPIGEVVRVLVGLHKMRLKPDRSEKFWRAMDRLGVRYLCTPAGFFMLLNAKIPTIAILPTMANQIPDRAKIYFAQFYHKTPTLLTRSKSVDKAIQSFIV